MRGSGIQQNPAFDFAGKSAFPDIKKERVCLHSPFNQLFSGIKTGDH